MATLLIAARVVVSVGWCLTVPPLVARHHHSWSDYKKAAAGADGQVAPAASKGTFSTLMRFTCCAHDFTTKISGGQNYVVENLYQESGVNYLHAQGVPGAPVSLNLPRRDRRSLTPSIVRAPSRRTPPP